MPTEGKNCLQSLAAVATFSVVLVSAGFASALLAAGVVIEEFSVTGAVFTASAVSVLVSILASATVLVSASGLATAATDVDDCLWAMRGFYSRLTDRYEER